MAVEREAEQARAGLHPREMPFEQRNPLDRIERHRLDQVDGRRARGDEVHLGQRLVPFLGLARIGDDPAARAERRVIVVAA